MSTSKRSLPTSTVDSIAQKKAKSSPPSTVHSSCDELVTEEEDSLPEFFQTAFRMLPTTRTRPSDGTQSPLRVSTPTPLLPSSPADSEVQVLSPSLFRRPVALTLSGNGLSSRRTRAEMNDFDSDEIVLMGTIRVTDTLPHMRPHCSMYPLSIDPEQFCKFCYCYICDDLATKCKVWKRGHCFATDQGSDATYWWSLRYDRKKQRHKLGGVTSRQAKVTAHTATVSTRRVTTTWPPENVYFQRQRQAVMLLDQSIAHDGVLANTLSSPNIVYWIGFLCVGVLGLLLLPTRDSLK